ncbi:unnamed protein product [Closterium sp. Yama58-4]|nr:unnamed protein product [Closterium sp. Yama58-4]
MQPRQPCLRGALGAWSAGGAVHGGGQVVYLSLDCAVAHAHLKPTSTIKVLLVKAVRAGGEGERKGGADQSVKAPAAPPLEVGSEVLSRADMVHYLDVGGWWHAAECECCFHHVLTLGAERAVTMESLDLFQSLLHTQQPRCTPLARASAMSKGVLEYSATVQAFGPHVQLEPAAQFPCKCTLAPLCAEVMLLAWMAEPCVGVLMDLGTIRSRLPAILAIGDSPATSPPAASAPPAAAAVLLLLLLLLILQRGPAAGAAAAAGLPTAVLSASLRSSAGGRAGGGQAGEHNLAVSMLVQVLGVKERAEFKEGFGFFVQHVLSGGVEKSHEEKKWKRGSWGEGYWGGAWGGETRRGRIKEQDFISARSCFKDSPQGKVVPMRHPFRDLPSVLVRFGAVPKPLYGSSLLPEWEEWPEGDEAAAKFPKNPSASCFGLGMAEGRRCCRSRGHVAAEAGPSKGVWVGAEARPMVRCRVDVDGILNFSSVLFVPPACNNCSRCITIYTSHMSVIALIATYAYRPAAALVQRFASVFPPHSHEYCNIFEGLGLHASYGRVRVLQQAVEEVPILFLLTLALHHSKALSRHCGAEGEHISKAGGGSNGAKGKAGRRRAGNRDSGEGGEGGESGRGEGDSGNVCEEVKSWFDAAMLPAAGTGAGRPACRGSEARE